MKSTLSGTVAPVLRAASRFVLIAVCGISLAGPGLCGTPDYQYTNIAPLPGGGIALDQQGRLDGQGAMQINIPVAYTPGWGYVAIGGFKGQHPSTHGAEFDNGSAVLGVGLFQNHRVYVSAMQVSEVWAESKAMSAQMSLIDETIATPAISVGVQDFLGKEHNGRSPYVVATKSLLLAGKGAFATVGYGFGRFLDRPFAGLSMPLTPNFNLAAEYDGFQWNGGLGWRPQGRGGNLTVLGSYNSETGWLLGANLAFSLMP